MAEWLKCPGCSHRGSAEHDGYCKRCAGEQTRAPERKEETRKKRIPLGTLRPKLSIDIEIPPDKVPRWINDYPGRLRQAETGGYAFLDDPAIHVGDGPDNRKDALSTKVRCLVGTNDDGSPLHAYLMVIDKDLYDEDQRIKQEPLKDFDKALLAGNVEGTVGVDGRYIPKVGITIKSKTGIDADSPS